MRKLPSTYQLLLFLALLYQTVFSQDNLPKPLRECWRIEDELLIDQHIASDNANFIYLVFSDSSIKSIEVISGKSVWRSEIGGEIVAPLVLDKKRIYAASKKSVPEIMRSNGALEVSITALSAATGVANWQKSFLAAAPLQKIYLLDDVQNLAVLTENGFFYSVGKTNGKMVAEKKLVYQIATAPFKFGGKIYFGTYDKKIVVLSIFDGHLISETNIKTVPTIVVPSDNNDVIYFSDKIGFVFAVREKNKKIQWSALTGASIADIRFISEGLLVSSNDNYIYLLSAKNGNRLWKRRLAGRSVGEPLIRDGTAVFSSFGSNEATFFDLRKGTIVNQVFLAGENYFIGNPTAGAGADSIIFPTLKGLYAFGSGKNCHNDK
jgi:outer membrane protein assembly factor BamB